MARSRNIKPGFFSNDDLVELDFATRLLFAGLWTVADKAGRLEDRPKKIKIAVFPADDVDIEAMLAALATRDFIVRYSVNGAAYIQIKNWTKHQNPHHTEKASTIPACSNGELTVIEPLSAGQSQEQDGGNPADSLIPDSLIPDSLHSVAKAPAKRAKQKSGLPEDFAPNEAGVKTALAAGIDVEAEVSQFRNHHAAKGSQMADWQAAWRTWVGNAVQFGRGGKGVRPAQSGWAKAAGFDSIYEAENAGCRQGNAHLFRDGKKQAVPA